MNELPQDEDSNNKISLEEDLEMGGEDPRAFYHDEMRDLQRDTDIQKLSHRMTLLFILVPCLLCALLAFAYLDVRGKMSQLQSSGAEEVQALSEDVVGKVESLSQQFEELEKSSAARLSILKDSFISMQEAYKKNQRKIEELGGTKADKKDLEQAEDKRFGEMVKTLSALQGSVADHAGAIETLSEKLKKELNQEANVITAVQSDLREQGEQVAKLVQGVEVLQKKALQLDLNLKLLADGKADKGAWKEFRLGELGKAALLEKKIESLAGDLSWLEKKLNVTREKRASEESAETPSKEETTPATPTGTAWPGSEKIIEQEIKE